MRFEVKALEADRELIRSLTRKLADGGPEAGGFAERCSRPSPAAPQDRGRFWPRCAAPRWSAPSLISRAPLRKAARSTCDTLSLDTNIISNVVKPKPSQPLLNWMTEQADDDLYIASLTVAEIRRGILSTAGQKRDALDAWFSGPEGPRVLFAGRILPFDENAGMPWARLMAEGKRAGVHAARLI